MFNPYGASPELEHLELHDLWKVTANGSDWTMFYHELAGSTEERVGVGLSRLAQTLLAGIAEPRKDNVKLIINEKVYTASLEEAKTLEPYLKHLDFGKDLAGNAPTSQHTEHPN